MSTTFYAIDFDRTLGNVERQVTCLNQFLESRGLLTPNELTVQINEAKAAGESFDVLGYIEAMHPGINPQSLQREYLSYAAEYRSELLLPGAVEVIQWLQQTERSFGIVSYGNKAWQALKIKAAGLDTLPCLIVATREKAALIATWKHDGVFVIPAELGDHQTYESVVLVDDHISAFDELSPGVRGYWVTHDTVEPPSGVVKIASLEEVIRYEATR